MNNYFQNIILLSLLISFIFTQKSLAQLNVVDGSFFHPSIMELNEYKHEFSLLLAKLPEDAIESTSAWIYAPLFTYSAKYGLPAGFNLNGSFSTNIITYQARAGGQWGYSFDRFTFAVGFDVAYWYGELNSFGFNSTAKGWQSYLYPSLGIAFEKFTLTFRGELNYLLTLEQTADDVVTISSRNIDAGISFAILIEQPVWKDNYMTLGVRFNYSKFYWPTWAVFPSWDRSFYIPEVIIGFVL